MTDPTTTDPAVNDPTTTAPTTTAPDRTGPTLPGAALAIAARDLRSRLRDRSLLITAIVAPLALAAILSFALGGSSDFTTSYGLVDDDGGLIAAAFTDLVQSPDIAGFATVERFDDAAAADAAIGDGIRAYWRVPEGFTAAVQVGEPASIEVVGSSDAATSTSIAESVARGFLADVEARSLAISLGASPTVAETGLPPALVVDAPSGEEVRDVAGTYFGPAMAVFFVFFVVGAGPRSLLAQRREGTLPRVLAAPIRPSAVLIGTSLSVLVLGMATMMIMWAATTLLFGADWGAPIGVVLLSLGLVLAAAAIAAFVTTLVRTEKQVEGVVSMVVFTFALLGGNFIQVDQMPDALRNVSLLTPNGWAMQGFVDLIAGSGITEVLPNLLALTVIAAVFALAALPRLRTVVSS